MVTTYIILAIAAIIPAAFYIFYIVAFDSYKFEPLKVLLPTPLLGAIAAIIVISFGYPPSLGITQITEAHGWAESIFIGFIGLALPAEFTKWLFLCVFLSLNKYYDEFVDGIVYSVCMAMGFAGVWCVWYMSDFSNYPILELMEKGLIVFFILIPLHLMASTFMGYYLALARKRHKIRNHLLALLFPTLIDGLLCSLVLLIGNHWEFYFFVAIIFSILAIIAYKQVFHLLKLDGIRF